MRRILLIAAAASGLLRAAVDWPVATPHSQGFDPGRLDAFQRDAVAHHTRATIVIRNGRIVLEWYEAGAGPDTRQGTASLAKALVGGMSLLVALNDGRIRPDDQASKFISRWRGDPQKGRITIRQLATHTSGISDAEQDALPHDRLPGWKGAFWTRKPDPISIALDQAPVLFDPGTANQYSNPGMAALAYAVTSSLHGAPKATFRRCWSSVSASPSAFRNRTGASATTKATVWMVFAYMRIGAAPLSPLVPPRASAS